MIDTKPNWVKGDTWVIIGGEVEVRGYVVVGGREREREMMSVVEVVLWWGLLAEVVGNGGVGDGG
ncbi:hypothetical protein Hanom_Chr08g00735231 [Helianthus anomalus]